METAEQEIRILRKKTKAWLASITFHSARGKINLGTFSRRLQSLFAPLFKPEIIQEALNDLPTESIVIKEATGIKKGIMSRLTPNKLSRRMLSYPEIPTEKTHIKENSSSFTLGRLIVTWAVLTDLSPQDFVEKVFPDVSRACVKLHDATGCRGLSDEEYYRYPQEAACFLSEILRALIRATPEEKLIRFMYTGIKALAIVIEMPGLEKEINNLLEQATHLMTKDALRKIEIALKENPDSRQVINVPELQAMILREEARLGWNRNRDKDAVKTLRESLSPELKEAVGKKDEVIKASIEAVSRRGLFNNLLDTLSGQLRTRVIENVVRFLKALVRVESSWEFGATNITKENTASIRRWLFRR